MPLKESEQTWEPGTIYMRSTDKEGRVTYTQHNCWNKTRFAVTMGINALEAGGKAMQCEKAEYQVNTRRR